MLKVVRFDSSNLFLGLSLLLVLVLASKVFSPRSQVFFLSTKTNISIFLFGLKSEGLVFLDQVYLY